MKRISFKHCVLLLAIAMGSPACQAPAESQTTSNEAQQAPQIFAEAPKFKAGRVMEGDKVEHRYLLKNKGNSTLHISKAKASCGCTAAVIGNSEIAPGAEGFIDVTFNSMGRRGHQVKTITIESDDPQNPRTFLTLEADVVVPVGFAQNKLHADLKVGEPWSSSVLIDEMTDETITLGEPGSDLEGLTARLLPRTDGQKGALCELSYLPKTQGKLRTTVTISTGLERQPRISLPLFFDISGDLQLTPAQLHLTPSEQMVSVRLSSEKIDFEILKTVDETNALQVKTVEITPKRAYELQFSLAPSQTEPKTFHGQVVIETTAPSAPKLQLPVSFRAATHSKSDLPNGLMRKDLKHFQDHPRALKSSSKPFPMKKTDPQSRHRPVKSL